MRLNSLEITNFRVIRRATINFPDKVIAIIGKNGHGKSSLIEAISWALYGNQASRSGKDEIKSTFADESENCEVKVSFYLNDQPYTVIRRLVGKSNRAEVELFRGENSESVGVNETKAQVGNLLGLDWRGFLSSFLARQSELNALSDLVPAKRKDHIAGMLGIERLDKAIQNLKIDTKQHKDRISFLERTLSEKDVIAKFISELDEKLKLINSKLAGQNDIHLTEQSNFEKIKKKYEEYSEKKNQFVTLDAELKAQKSSFEIIQKQKTEIESEIKVLAETNTKLQLLQVQQKLRKDIPKQFEEYKVLQNNKKYVKDLQGQQKSIEDNIKESAESLKSQSLIIEEKKKEFQQYPENLDSIYNEKQSLLEQKRAEYSGLHAELERLKLDIQKLQIELANISSLKADSICERCLRPLGEDFEGIKKHISDEIAGLEKLQTAKLNQSKQLKAEGEELKKFTDKLSLDIKKVMLLKPEIESLLKEIAKLESILSTYTSQRDTIIEKLHELGNVEFDEQAFLQLQKEYEIFEKNKIEIERYKVQLERGPRLQTDLESKNNKLAEIEKIQQAKSKALESLDFSTEEYQKITELFNTSQKSFEDSKGKLFEIQKEQELTSLSLHEKKIQQKQFQESEKEFELSKSAHYYGEKLSNLFSLYRHDLIASIRPTLADISSRLFDEMTNHKYNFVELDEKYELRVMDNGQYYGVERFSGGEKDLANLCLRLAISLSLTESAGMKGSFIILDEVFSSQDNERKENILKALTNLKNRFPQIILITHIEDLKDGVEQIIEVKQDESTKISEVFVHGA